MQSKYKLILLMLASAALGGCAGLNGFWDDLRGTPQYYSYSDRERPLALTPAFPRQCIGDDQRVLEFGQCAASSGSCYQLIDGAWCTAPYTVAETNYAPPEAQTVPEPQK